MHMAIPICIQGWVARSIPIYIWGSPYAYKDFSMLICPWGMGQQRNLQSPYACGDWPGPLMHMSINNLQSLYAYGDWQGPHTHMWIVQSLICLQMIFVCIWGFGHQIPMCKNLHMGISFNPRLHKGSYHQNLPKICIWQSLFAIFCLHMVINICKLCPYIFVLAHNLSTHAQNFNIVSV